MTTDQSAALPIGMAATPPWSRTATLLIATAMVAVLEFRIYTRSRVLLGSLDLSLIERGLIFWSLWAKSIVLVGPCLIARWVCLSRGWRRAASLAGVVAPVLILVWLVSDAKLHSLTGAHLSLYLREVFVPQNWPLSGDAGGFVWPVSKVIVCTLLAMATVVFAGGQLRHAFQDRHRRQHAWIGPAKVCVLVGLVLGCVVSRQFVPQTWAIERLHMVLPTTALFFSPDDVPGGDQLVFGVPAQQAFETLGTELQAIANTVPKLDQRLILDETQQRPNVLILIVESWRYHALCEEQMPKLTRWGQQGLNLKQHVCQSNESANGAFALLYGRLALNYDATLNAQALPQIAATLRASGYESSLIASCTFEYHRMDGFFNGRVFDTQQLQADPRWHAADRITFQRIAKQLQDAQRPQFIVSYIMSTHYGYDSPPEQGAAEVAAVNPSSMPLHEESVVRREELARRYQRSIKFIDDELGQLVASLDPQRNLIVVTGDHGESLFEDGVLCHGTRLSEIQTRTPCLIVGPGIPSAETRVPTGHCDVVPTVLHALLQQPVRSPQFHGVDLLSQTARPPILVQSHIDSWDVLLSHAEGRFVVNVPKTSDRVRVIGFYDSFGRVISQTSAPGSPTLWRDRVSTRLTELTRPAPQHPEIQQTSWTENSITR